MLHLELALKCSWQSGPPSFSTVKELEWVLQGMAAVVAHIPPAWPHRPQAPLPQRPDIAVPPCHGLTCFLGQTSCLHLLQLRAHSTLTGAWTCPSHSADAHVTCRPGLDEAAIISSCQNQTLF